MSFSDLLIHTCNISRATSGTADSYGQPTKTWTNIATNEPCRLAQTGGREIKVGAEVVIAQYKLFLDNTDITERDKIVMGTGTYEVLLVEQKSGINAHHLECYLERVS
jgi:hypothetical protein